MDFNSIKDAVSNMTLYDIKAGVRKVQNAVMNYTEMEAKVREATNNEPWGASSTLMQEIANGTFNYATLNEIMPMIYRRFTEKAAEEWRQIYKALQLLEFLIKHGSERVIDDARGHITLLKMLRQFHFIDQNGKDQGVNVRNRAKELAELLSDVDRIRAERKKARFTKNKYTGVEGGTSLGGGFPGGAGNYGGFGNESTDYGGYSGGVYGDGGGFGGQSSDFRDTSSRRDKFEEYDEFDEGERPNATHSSPKAKRVERTPVKRAEPEKKKAPEVDLFSFDDAVPASASAAAPALSNSSGLASLAGPANTADEDDDFDDFQSATPAPQTSAPSNSFALQAPITATASTAQFVAPKPQSAPQQANLSNMVSASSISPTPSGGNYSAFSTPAMASPTGPLKPTGYQPSGPNYFQSVQAGAPQPTSSAMLGSPAASGMKPVMSPAAKPAAAGGDAFGALWGQASANLKKTDTTTSGPALGQLAKEKSSAGIWGAPASSTTATRPMGGASSGTSTGNGLDLLG